MYLNRKSATRNKRKILIVCEGEKTEPNYFKNFPINKNDIKIIVIGTGYQADRLVEEAINLKAKAESEKNSYNKIWCVFDRDSAPTQNINRAFQLADNNNIKIAYSNEAFELWYILHFDYLQSALSRDKYITRLNKLLGYKYEKNNKNMYKELKNKQIKAINNAKKLLSIYPKFDPINNKPLTTVYELVEELNQYK